MIEPQASLPELDLDAMCAAARDNVERFAQEAASKAFADLRSEFARVRGELDARFDAAIAEAVEHSARAARGSR